MNALDRLRSYYVRSPHWVHQASGPLLAVIPPDLQYGRSFRAMQTAIVRSEREPEFVDHYVGAHLRSLLTRAKTTPYYARTLSAVDPYSVSRTDFTLLPIVDREILRANIDRMLAVPKQQLDESMTSGTSDLALTVYLDKDRSVREWAFVTNAWRRGGYRAGDRRAVIRSGYDLRRGRSDYWTWQPGMRELRLTPYRMIPSVMDEYLELIERFRIAFIHGYPSAISLLASHASRVRWSPPSTLRGVLPISESLLPNQRRIMRDAFGQVPIAPFYGLTEKVAFAAEVIEEPDLYEFEPLYGIAEVVGPDGRQLQPGLRGRLVGTGFISTGLPLVRYFTGDLATVVQLPTAENCWRLRVNDLVSVNRQTYLVTGEGGLVTTTSVYPYNTVVREYQFVQRVPGRATLRVVPEVGASREDLEAACRRIDLKTDGLLLLDLDIVDEIPTTPRGKRLYVEQHLDLKEYGLADD